MMPSTHAENENQPEALLPIEQAPTQLFTLHDMRKRSGFTGAAVAEMCKTTYQSIRNWENGAPIPSIINVLELLKVYGYTIDQLDLTPFYTKANSKKEKGTQAEKNIKCDALVRLDEMRRQHAPDAT